MFKYLLLRKKDMIEVKIEFVTLVNSKCISAQKETNTSCVFVSSRKPSSNLSWTQGLAQRSLWSHSNSHNSRTTAGVLTDHSSKDRGGLQNSKNRSTPFNILATVSQNHSARWCTHAQRLFAVEHVFPATVCQKHSTFKCPVKVIAADFGRSPSDDCLLEENLKFLGLKKRHKWLHRQMEYHLWQRMSCIWTTSCASRRHVETKIPNLELSTSGWTMFWQLKDTLKTFRPFISSVMVYHGGGRRMRHIMTHKVFRVQWETFAFIQKRRDSPAAGRPKVLSLD